MPTAKPRFEDDASWKCPIFGSSEWDALTKHVQVQLRPFYPDKQAVACPAFGHPADQWANTLLSAAHTAMDMELWNNRRITVPELRAEISQVSGSLKKKGKFQKKLSHDLIVLLGPVELDCHNIDSAYITHLISAQTRLATLPKAKKVQDAQHLAAVEMVVSISHILKESGIPLAATAGSGYYSDAVEILKILGDALKLRLAETTWKKAIMEARKNRPDL